MAAPMCETARLDSLATDPLLLILGFLDFKDIISCHQTCRRLRDLTCHDSIWKHLCIKHWMKMCREDGLTWQEEFISMFKDYGSYIDCYLRIYRAWKQIESYMKTYLPHIYETLQEGSTEADLDALELRLQEKLPNDYRCSYRIHNGQSMDANNGLMGGVSLYNHFQSSLLLTLDRAVDLLEENEDYWQGVVPLTLCRYTPYKELLSVTEEHGVSKGRVFVEAIAIGGYSQDFLKKDYFIAGQSFSDWLCTYAQQLEDDIFPRVHNEVYKFYHEPSTDITTSCVKAQCSTCFMPSVSIINPPRFRHAYRITLSMSPDAPRSASCRLITRHWEIEDGKGEKETVDGLGVVGEHPVLYPGTIFSWTSGTFFSTTSGKMWGHFTMRKLHSDELVEVKCPVFSMNSLPCLTYEERTFISAPTSDDQMNSKDS